MPTLTKSENADEMPQNVAFHQDLHRLLRHKISSEYEIYFCLVLCLFDLILYVPSTIFQLNRDGSSWVEPVLS